MALVVTGACLGLLAIASVDAKAACQPFKFVGAAGSGQRSGDNLKSYHGVGDMLDVFYNNVTIDNGIPQSMIPLVDVKYGAVGVNPFDASGWEAVAAGANGLNAAGFPIGNGFWNSVGDGSRWLVDFVDRHSKSRCRSKTKLILAGYSQGAAVVNFAWKSMSHKQRSTVARLVVFGDPLFTDFPNAYIDYDTTRSGAAMAGPLHDAILDAAKWRNSDPVISFCNKGDLVCQGNRHAFGLIGGPSTFNPIGVSTNNHSLASYVSNGLIKVAKAMLTNKLKLKQLAATPVVDDSRKGPSDIVFAVDTTGSMSNEIDVARDSVNSMAAKLAATAPDFRVALVEYRDYDEYDPDDYQSRVVLPFTTDLNALRDGLDSLHASGGGDWEESVYSGIRSALNIGFRPGAKKSVIVLGDAPPKSPEPLTGLTGDSVVAEALAAGPVQVFGVCAISDESDWDSFRSVVTRTGGVLFNLNDYGSYAFASSRQLANGVAHATPMAVPSKIADATSDALSEALLDAVAATSVSPVASVMAPSSAIQGRPTRLRSAIHSDEVPTRIDWDLNGDGEYETVGAGGSIATTFANTGLVTVAARYTLGDGVVSVGRATIDVRPPVSIGKGKGLIGSVSHLRVRNSRRSRTVTFTYLRKAITQPLPTFTVRNRRNRVVGGAVAMGSGKRIKVRIRLSRSSTRRGRYALVGEAWSQLDSSRVVRQKRQMAKLRLR